MKRWATALLLLAIASPAFACINTFASIFMDYKRAGDTEAMASQLRYAEEAYRKHPTFENTNDLAVGLILSDRKEQGIKLLRDLERDKPGSAIVAANLGTALELSSQDAEALHWIREGVRRDPKEHFGSEWVHVKILEAKLELKKNPDWLLHNSVLGWKVGDPPLVDEAGKPRLDVDVENAISYQLNERTTFIRPPDAIIGDLYVTMGDLEIARVGDAPAQGPANGHSWAIDYGTVHEARVLKINEERQARFDEYLAERAQQAKRARDEATGTIRQQMRAKWIGGALLAAVLGYWLWRRAGNRRLNISPTKP
jgi:hypothetical protein